MKAEKILWDTWAFLALADKSYRYHQLAHQVNEYLKQTKAIFVTTQAILTEVGNGFSKVNYRAKAIEQIEFAHQMADEAHGEIITIEPRIWDEAYRLYKSRPDKDWGHTDCISFIVMRELGIQKTFTADHHFEQAGFERLVKPN